MSLETHSDLKYSAGEVLSDAADWDALRIEHRHVAAGAPSMHEQRFKRVLDFIESNLARDMSLDRLAAEACLSPYHFSRLFQQATGASPHRYVTSRRVQAAQKMLLSTACPLVQIAIDTGFGCQANFTRVFRKMTGMSPGKYRELTRR